MVLQLRKYIYIYLHESKTPWGPQDDLRLNSAAHSAGWSQFAIGSDRLEQVQLERGGGVFSFDRWFLNAVVGQPPQNLHGRGWKREEQKGMEGWKDGSPTALGKTRCLWHFLGALGLVS